jgi:predicted RNase H-like HicB family nuclease
MALDLATVTKTEINLPPQDDLAAGAAQYTAVAVFDGARWSALCRELDIASDGESAMEALANMKNAVREALAVAADHGVRAGQPVADDDLREFLTSHQGRQPVTAQVFVIR